MVGRLSNRNYQLILLIVYAILALLLTWPTVSHFTSYVPGDGIDDPAIVWNLWWIKYSLLNEPQFPLLTEMMFYPVGINLAFYTLTTLNGLTALPLLLNVGVVAASNIHMWFSLVLGAYGAFLLNRYILLAPPWNFTTSSRIANSAAALTGLIFAFASSKLFYIALGQFNIASTHWIPFTILFFIKMRRDPGNWRWAALAALFLTMQAWTELTHASFLLVFMVLYWLYWLTTDLGRRVIRWPYLKSALLLVVLFAIGISPFLGAMLPDMRAEGDFLVEGGGFADNFSSDVAGFLVPSKHHPLLGNFISQTNITFFDKGQQIYLGYSLLVLAIIGVMARRRDPVMRFWLIASLIFALLMLGPKIMVNGQNTGFRGLFNMMQQLPIFNGNRYPSRYSVMLFLSLAPLAALGFTWLADKRPFFLKQVAPLGLSIILGGLFLFEHLSLPLPQTDLTIPEPYQIIAQDESDFTVLDIPFGLRNGFRVTGAETVGIMFGQFYQTYHQKPLLHGNTSRNPEQKFQYFSDAPIIKSLISLERGQTLPTGQLAQDAPYAEQFLQLLNIKYIVVRPESPGEYSNPQAVIPYIEGLFPVEKLVDEPDFILYQVDLPPPPNRVDLLQDAALSPLYLAEGWGVPGGQTVAQRETVRLLVPLDRQAQTMRLTVRIPDNAPAIFTTMTIELNGWRSEAVRLARNWHALELEIPASAVQSGLNNVYLHFSHVMPAAPEESDITVISAGQGGGNLGHIYLNGSDVSPNQTGYNIALIDPQTGLVEAANFNTNTDPAASQAMAQFIEAADENLLIAVAAKDEASGELSSGGLTAEAVAALQSIGGQVDLRGQFRASHALIGSKNGSVVLEASDSLEHPAEVTTGLGLVEPHIAAIFQSITFETTAPEAATNDAATNDATE